MKETVPVTNDGPPVLLPAGVVEDQRGDDLASLQVQAAQVGQTVETNALEQRNAHKVVVETHHCCEKDPIAETHLADGLHDDGDDRPIDQLVYSQHQT